MQREARYQKSKELRGKLTRDYECEFRRAPNKAVATSGISAPKRMNDRGFSMHVKRPHEIGRFERLQSSSPRLCRGSLTILNNTVNAPTGNQHVFGFTNPFGSGALHVISWGGNMTSFRPQ